VRAGLPQPEKVDLSCALDTFETGANFNLRVGCRGQCLSNVNHMYVTLNVFQYFELNMVMGNDVQLTYIRTYRNLRF
jgi:hypothetical protein